MFGGKISRVWILVIFLTIILGLYSVQTVNVEAIETIDDKSAVKGENDVLYKCIHQLSMNT